MDTFRTAIKTFILDWLNTHIPAHADWIYAGIVLLWIALVAIAVHLLLHRTLAPFLKNRTLFDKIGWQDSLFTHKLYRRLSMIAQGGVIYMQAQFWLKNPSPLLSFINLGTKIWMLAFGLLAFFSLLDTLHDALSRRSTMKHFPLRGILQTIKLVSWVLIAIVVVALLLGKSPLYLLSGLGALSAVLMLVFKDPILGLVSGIQLSANNMLAVGDWLEMPKYHADGTVTDIGLTTVKVQNWDKTITTVPTYALISDSFKNWRGMSESGARRIKRHLALDISSIRFLDAVDIERLRKAQLLGNYLQEKTASIDSHKSISNDQFKVDLSSPLNARRLTNVGTFRAYLKHYLQAHPDIRQDLTILVRQLQPGVNGLPIEIYAFSRTTEWLAYENIIGDIFDHIFAVLSEFDLRAHEAPTGYDFQGFGTVTTERSTASPTPK